MTGQNQAGCLIPARSAVLVAQSSAAECDAPAGTFQESPGVLRNASYARAARRRCETYLGCLCSLIRTARYCAPGLQHSLLLVKVDEEGHPGFWHMPVQLTGNSLLMWDTAAFDDQGSIKSEHP